MDKFKNLIKSDNKMRMIELKSSENQYYLVRQVRYCCALQTCWQWWNKHPQVRPPQERRCASNRSEWRKICFLKTSANKFQNSITYEWNSKILRKTCFVRVFERIWTQNFKENIIARVVLTSHENVYSKKLLIWKYSKHQTNGSYLYRKASIAETWNKLA